MIHKKIHKHLKRKVHHNRWLSWTIAASLLAALALVGYIEVSNVEFDSQMSAPKHLWQQYRSNSLGFSMRFPPDWVMESDAGIVSVSDPDENSEITITVFEPAAEPLVRRALDILNEQQIRLNGYPAAKISNQIAPQALETVILVVVRGNLYRITGFGGYFESVVSTIKFLEPTAR